MLFLNEINRRFFTFKIFPFLFIIPSIHLFYPNIKSSHVKKELGRVTAQAKLPARRHLINCNFSATL